MHMHTHMHTHMHMHMHTHTHMHMHMHVLPSRTVKKVTRDDNHVRMHADMYISHITCTRTVKEVARDDYLALRRVDVVVRAGGHHEHIASRQKEEPRRRHGTYLHVHVYAHVQSPAVRWKSCADGMARLLDHGGRSGHVYMCMRMHMHMHM